LGLAAQGPRMPEGAGFPAERSRQQLHPPSYREMPCGLAMTWFSHPLTIQTLLLNQMKAYRCGKGLRRWEHMGPSVAQYMPGALPFQSQAGCLEIGAHRERREPADSARSYLPQDREGARIARKNGGKVLSLPPFGLAVLVRTAPSVRTEWCAAGCPGDHPCRSRCCRPKCS